ncbi:Brix-domain-containing protein [Hanseniaspora valbyensis NRRL Y-1626]|uniref:Brix-domain-containing protein n=1 Tax=Hanseniaspora valbyensis NRRL Y-1626 TaxID=766949 RepID=A0A1B7TBA9_9ASCO|nr:Brix-domain-containing protein [Hanseniaspora valbyensis NRRL Y-1626]
MEVNSGKVNSVKSPTISKAPPMVVNSGKPVMLVNLVLLATTKAPPKVFKLDRDNSVKSSLETTFKVTPIEVMLSMFKLVKVLLMKPMDWLTLVKALNSTEPAPKIVTLLAHSKLLKINSKSSPLEEMDKPLEIVLIGESIVTKSPLLLMLKTETSSKLLKPSKEVKEVSEITMLSAESKAVMMKLSKTGKATKEIELTEVKEERETVWIEVKKHQDLYLWVSKNPNGPTIKFLLQDIHTALEQQFLGNCLKGSRPIVLFDKSFNDPTNYQCMIFKELLGHTFGVSPNSRKLKPFIDHITLFSLIDGKIWVRNYEIQSKVKNLTEYENSLENEIDENDDLQLIELGPRFIMTPILILEGCFGGPKIWENENYVSPNSYRSFMKMEAAKQAIGRQEKKEQRKLNKRENVIAANELSNDVVFKQ